MSPLRWVSMCYSQEKITKLRDKLFSERMNEDVHSWVYAIFCYIAPNEFSKIIEGLKEIKQDKNAITVKMLKNIRQFISPVLSTIITTV